MTIRNDSEHFGVSAFVDSVHKGRNLFFGPPCIWLCMYVNGKRVQWTPFPFILGIL